MGGLKNIFLLFVLSCTPTNGVQIGDMAEQTIEYVSRSTSSTVKLSRESTVKILAFSARGTQVSGTGAYVKYKGYHFVLTAAHVVSGGDSALVVSGDEKILAEVAYLDAVNDIAVLRLEGIFTRRPLLWNKASTRVGTRTIYTGFPNNYSHLTVEWCVSGFTEKYIVLHSYAWSGSSGSVVLSERGRIVGIVSAVDVGYVPGMFPQLVEDIVLVAPIEALKESDLIDCLSN